MDLRIDDLLQLKKPHACGANAWRLYRVGADLGLRCAGCDRMLLTARRDIERRIRSVERDGQVLKPHNLK